jgi:hypothetical protein
MGTDGAVIESYGYYRAADTMRRAAELLGKAPDAARYAALAGSIADAFNARFFDWATHSYAGGYQAAAAVALDMGIVPAEERQALVDTLVASIRAPATTSARGLSRCRRSSGFSRRRAAMTSSSMPQRKPPARAMDISWRTGRRR